MPIYLDHNSTTQPLPEVVEAMREALESHWPNPSSVHRQGQSARQAVELARRHVAELLDADARQVIFTSGATESIALAIRGVLGAMPPQRKTVLTTPIEHEAVHDCMEADPDAHVEHLSLDQLGRVDLGAFTELLDAKTPELGLVSVQWANNETGIIQPVEAIGRACRERDVLFHTDATQWVGKMPCRIDWGPKRGLGLGGRGDGDGPAGSPTPEPVPIDLLSCSAHKFHGPKGVGALAVRRGVRFRPTQPGAQELGRRGGTENVPGIVGMGAAACAARAWLNDPGERTRLGALRDRFERGVVERTRTIGVHAQVNPPKAGPQDRLWNTTNIAFAHLEAEALLLLLSERGIAASAGAACSSGSLDPSPVLLAMGIPESLAHGSLRFSLARNTSDTEVDDALRDIPQAVAQLSKSADGVLGG